MKYIADLHNHSHYSRATSKNSTLEGFYQWARIKGINLLGTGDFTHPAWFDELKKKLSPDGNGFFKLKKAPKEQGIPGIITREIDIRFCLSVEISSIYKKNGKTRKIHNLIFVPDFSSAEKIRAKLATIGNIASDGRPILGLDSRNLLEIVLETSEEAFLIPAHIWTPWFSLFGSKSGFDRIEECYEDLSDYIFALETGLSSDPEMNWRLSSLDKYSLISNSDSHSPQKLGREANIFDTELTYQGMFNALKNKKGHLGTIEFFPEEGKYHMDGHRNCNICLDPDETIKLNNICPVCGKSLTIGVMHRVVELADRKKGRKPRNAAGFRHLIPLPEILSELYGKGPNTKAVTAEYVKAVSMFGNEFSLLMDAPAMEIENKLGSLASKAIQRMRNRQVYPKPGFDGEFGKIRVFKQGEIEALR